jgi:hypothetical protein
MSNRYDFSELEEIIRLALKEQAIHPQGLNSSQIHGTLYPAGDPRNKDQRSNIEASLKAPASGSSKLMRTGIGSRRNWA